MALPRLFALVPVCSQSGSRLAAFPVGRAERSEKAEGKIKETGTPLARFLGKPLSAHCFGAALAAPWVWTPRAATSRKALALLGFERHYGPKSAVFRGFAPEALA
ncbi:hypothetical protein CN878_18900 [Ochrobactrum sp. 695/2009]|nr:hypothetical protein CN881_08945 [Ochrobactrum sp. 721/2009]PJT14790.1 hypothetical protein CN880_15750 [Ochrobactrum sp. 720/2009]PJT20379.1 hypothetical protein CN879_18765 [Ochrobactrum sp. 715/2009]PJT28349.1 hypothetical protein CN878_18900 [Ochrobactrum sp. 695/2009]PJT34811.1 hypothetical protein CN877_01585 [Ochrobactrum sp. 689/2009]